MKQNIRWGILGTGNIAKLFATGLQATPDAELLAVGSRSVDTAQQFASLFNIPRKYPTYEQLANDPDIDVVYIATPHPFHMDNTNLCLNAGKAVLCEKPFAINASQVKKMIELARSKNLFLMEAMWTRFLPLITELRQWLKQNLIGQPRMLQANFGFKTNSTSEPNLFNPELAGGALLDVGVYCISLASMLFGQPPQKITSIADIGQTGVDEQSAFILGYDKGRLAVLTCAISTDTQDHAIISGTKGSIKIHSPFWQPTAATISIEGKDNQLVEMPLTGNGYNYEAQEVIQCIKAGKLESNIMPLDETLTIVKTMDDIRAQWGLKYPNE